MSPRSGNRRLGRRSARRAPGHIIAVFCEGETEHHYLNEIKQRYRTATVQVELAGSQGTPITVVERAVERCAELSEEQRVASRRRKRDPSVAEGTFEVWAVCDRDVHHRFHEAAQKARHVGVGFAWSTPCVELWALLHLRDQTAHIHHHDCQRALHDEMPRYHHDKAPYFDLEMLTEAGQQEALLRSLNLHRRAIDGGDEFYNPTTALWKLVKAIEHGGAKKAREAADEESCPSANWWLPEDPGGGDEETPT